MPLEGLQLGNYQLQRLIGSGGMGEVYLASDIRINRQVAIKIVRTEITAYPDINATKESARLFQREMRAITTLDHPHILHLFDFGEKTINKATLTYMVMPYRPEGSLSDWLQQRGSSHMLSPEDVGHLIQQAASALQHAHTRQILHQDVKPANFLIHTNEADPSHPDLLLADFGVAKFTSATTSISHTIRGTPTYMAPEQWSGEPVPATDQYALAIMAYELLTGQPPFKGPPMRMMYLHATAQPQPPSALNSRIFPAIDAVILRALEKKSEDRFPSISAFAQAFQQAVQENEASNAPTAQSLPNSTDIPATPVISSGSFSNTRGATAIPVSSFNNVPTFPSQGNRAQTTVPPFDSVRDKKTRSRGTVALLLGVVLLIIGISVGLFSVVKSNQIANNNATASAATKTIAAASGFNATATAAATTATNPYLAGGTLKLNDSFSTVNSNPYQWEDDTTPMNLVTQGQCRILHGSYDMQSEGPNYCLASASSFSNFVYQMQVTLVQGNEGGIVFRTTDPNQLYYFYISVKGMYSLDIDRPNGQPYQALSAGFSSVIKQGLQQTNLLAVVVIGNTIDLYVNLHKLAEVHDSTYASGYVGVAVGLAGETNLTEVVYHYAKVWTL